MTKNLAVLLVGMVMVVVSFTLDEGGTVARLAANRHGAGAHGPASAGQVGGPATSSSSAWFTGGQPSPSRELGIPAEVPLEEAPPELLAPRVE